MNEKNTNIVNSICSLIDSAMKDSFIKKEEESFDESNPETYLVKGLLISSDEDNLRRIIEKHFKYIPFGLYKTNSNQFYIEFNKHYYYEIVKNVSFDCFFHHRASKTAWKWINEYEIDIKDRRIYLINKDEQNHDNDKLVTLELKNRICDFEIDQEYDCYNNIEIDVKLNSYTKKELADLKWNMFYEKYMKRLADKERRRIVHESAITFHKHEN